MAQFVEWISQGHNRETTGFCEHCDEYSGSVQRGLISWQFAAMLVSPSSRFRFEKPAVPQPVKKFLN